MTEIFSAFYSIINSFSSLISIFTYVAMGYGLYSMARSCGIDRPWMSWVPLCNIYLMGKIADHHCERNESKTTTYRKKLLGLDIAILAVAIVAAVATIITLVAAILQGGDLSGLEDAVLSENADAIVEMFISALSSVLPAILSVSVVWLALGVVAIVYTVFYYIAMYKVFKLFDERNAVLYIVLSIFFNIAVPIIFLILAKKQPAYPYSVAPEGASDTDPNFYSL